MVQVCPDRGNVDAARWIGYQYLLGITGVPCDEQMGQRYPTQVVDAGHQAAGVSDGFYLSEHPSCSRARRDAGGWRPCEPEVARSIPIFTVAASPATRRPHRHGSKSGSPLGRNRRKVISC